MIAPRHPAALLVIAACSLSPLCAAPATAERASGVFLSASRLSLSADGREALAEGGVRLVAPGLELRTERLALSLPDGALRLEAPFSLEAGDFGIRADSGVLLADGSALRLERPEILRRRPLPALALGGDELACDGGGCTLRRAHGTACPHEPAGYRVEADEVTLHPSGDIDLVRPALRLGGTTVARLPWLRLRPESEPGFLAPKIGYSREAGLIAGPAGHLPLGGGAHADGYVAGRTAEGFEDGTRLLAPGVDLNVEHVYSAPRGNEARGRLGLRAPLRGAAFAADADVVTGRRILDDLTFDPLERAVSHTASRVLLSLPAPRVLWESALAAFQGFTGRAAGARPGFDAAASIRGALVPLPNPARVWPGLDLRLERRGASDGALYDAYGAYAPPHTFLSVEPSLAAPFALGPLSLAVAAGSRHAAWLVDAESGAPASRHDVGAAAQIALPLVGHPGGREHVVTPRVAYRIAPLVSGGSPPWAFRSVDSAREGHAIEAGLGTALDPFAPVPLVDAGVAQRLFLPGLGSGGAAYLFAHAVVGARWLELRGELAWDQRLRSISAAAAGIGTADDRGDRISIGGRWYGRGDGPHLDGRWSGASPPWPRDEVRPAFGEDLLELAPEASAVLARMIALDAGARVGIFPRAGLNALWYGVALRAACGCAEIGVRAAHRLDTWVPDLLVTLVVK